MSPELEKRLEEVVEDLYDPTDTYGPGREDIMWKLRPLLTEAYNAGLEAAAMVLIVQGGLLKTNEERVDAIRALKENP